ncbi:Six-hairpin glycosidase [Linderina pennispora]|uniref:Six-hairpin glycosidase n=1 Tax=Linderina pennispora TaxID=61395 RepID=A0A1Y1VWD3_9FUNG|nr:Six-hairpin glycosidase [Linderina pennispora]ORX65608.1 Six-hairpin glycosidase [Linderina pennispora]
MKISFSFTSLLALSSLATGSLANTFRSAKWAAIPPDYNTDTASMYESQAAPITGNMTSFWNNDKNLILPAINSNGGVGKPANIDSQVFLAALHASLGDGFYTVDSDQMLASVVAKTNAFKPLYPINADTEATVNSATMPIATWSTADKVTVTKATGTFFNQMKELYGIGFTNVYEVGATYTSDSDTFGEFLANTMLSGDRYMARVAHHTDASGSMTEQWLRGEGTPTGAPNLTWPFEVHTSAARHRAAASRIVYGN